MKRCQLLGIIIAVVLIVFSAVYPVPEKHVHVSSSSKAYDYSWSKNTGAEYIGGDCYNYQIEASLKAGYLTGILAIKGMTFVGGLLLLFLTLYSRLKCEAIEAQTKAITELVKHDENRENNIEESSDNADGQSTNDSEHI